MLTPRSAKPARHIQVGSLEHAQRRRSDADSHRRLRVGRPGGDCLDDPVQVGRGDFDAEAGAFNLHGAGLRARACAARVQVCKLRLRVRTCRRPPLALALALARARMRDAPSNVDPDRQRSRAGIARVLGCRRRWRRRRRRPTSVPPPEPPPLARGHTTRAMRAVATAPRRLARAGAHHARDARTPPTAPEGRQGRNRCRPARTRRRARSGSSGPPAPSSGPWSGSSGTTRIDFGTQPGQEASGTLRPPHRQQALAEPGRRRTPRDGARGKLATLGEQRTTVASGIGWAELVEQPGDFGVVLLLKLVDALAGEGAHPSLDSSFRLHRRPEPRLGDGATLPRSQNGRRSRRLRRWSQPLGFTLWNNALPRVRR